ncbi:MAG: Wzz/FepE/Etk N-terminal domain-containing protein [Bacteroidota bacterium]
MTDTPNAPESSTPGSSFLEFLTVLTRHRRFIVRFVLGATLVAGVTAFFMPKWYRSTASVFPAEKADLFGALEGVSGLMRSFSPARALGGLTGNTETDRYMAILKSGKVLGAVIGKFDLVNVYGITSYPMEKTTKELLNNVEFRAEPEGNLTVTVYDRDPRRAADMANYFVEMLNRVNTELQSANARGNRLFVEERYRKNLTDLAAAEDSLRAFQQRYGIIAMPEQTEASIKAAAEIAGQLALKEVQAGVLRRTQGEEHPSVRAAAVEIEELGRKLAEMNSGTGGPGMSVFVPFSRVPALGGEYVRRFRDVEIQYKILQFLTPLYEQAKVEERRQTPSVVVLDRAAPAERKSKPKATLWALIAFTVSSLVAVVGVFLKEALVRLRQSHPDRFNGIASALRSDWFGLRFRGGRS